MIFEKCLWMHVLECLKKLVVSVNLQWKINIVIDVHSANILEQSYPTKSYLSLFHFLFFHIMKSQHGFSIFNGRISDHSMFLFNKKIAIAVTLQKKRKRQPPRIDHECFAPVSLGWGRSHDAYKTTRKPYTHVAFREKPFFGIIENPKVYESFIQKPTLLKEVVWGCEHDIGHFKTKLMKNNEKNEETSHLSILLPFFPQTGNVEILSKKSFEPTEQQNSPPWN